MLSQALCIILQPSVNSYSSLSPKIPDLGRNWQFVALCDLKIWRMTLKNNRAPRLCYLKLSSSFHSHLYILTGVTVRKCPNWDKICFDHCDLELGPLALTFSWTSLFSMVITPANFMMIRWEQHSENGVAERQGSWTDGQTDGRTERSVLRAAWSQLKYQTVLIYSC